MSSDHVILAKIKMINMGIAPAITGDQLLKMLDSMTPKERRSVKRKFRKLWRKLAKSNKELGEIMGLGNDKPTKAQKRNRSAYISIEVVKEIKKLMQANF